MDYTQRKARALRKNNWEKALRFDYARIAELIHAEVQKVTGDNGLTWCLTYASLTVAYLNHWSGPFHTIVGGKFVVKTKSKPVAFEHFWCGRQNPDRGYTVIDMSTRHNAALIRKNLPDAEPDFVDDAVLTMPYYVGPVLAGPFGYQVEVEATEWAVREHLRQSHYAAVWVKRTQPFFKTDTR